MSTLRSIPPVCLALLLAAGTTAAQAAAGDPDPQPSSFFLAAGGGAAIPMGDFGDVANTGWQADARAGFQVNRVVGVYLAYRFASFPLDDALADDDVTLQAPEAGITLHLGSGTSVAPWVRLGAFAPRFEASGDHDRAGVGLRASLGAEMRLGGGFSVAADVDGDWCGTGPKIPPFGPHPPRPWWWAVELQGRFTFR